MEKLRNSYVWWTVKIITALFQFPATWAVFSDVFDQAGRSSLLVGISTFMSILLIDVFFIAVLHFLEDEEIDPIQKIPLVVVGLGLLIAIIAIGYMDEGILSWAPRLGFIGLVVADVFNWFLEYRRWLNSRERFDMRERDKIVKERLSIMNQERSKVLNDPRVQEIIFRIQARRLGKELNVEEFYGVTLDVLINEELQEHEEKEVRQYFEPIYSKENDQFDVDQFQETMESLYQFEEKTFLNHYYNINGVSGEIYSVDGMYYFVSPETNELFYKTSQGKPYTKSGAKIALSRHLK